MIKQAVVASLWPALVLTGALCSSCSLMLDWDPNKQPCNTDASLPECDDGYSCASGLCVGDRTIPRGDDCAKDKQRCDGELGGADARHSGERRVIEQPVREGQEPTKHRNE